MDVDAATTATDSELRASTSGSAAVDDGRGSAASAAEQELALSWWATFLGVFVLFTLFGNILVVLSVIREKHLRSVTNYFIVSLAVADITVGALVMPLAVYVEVLNGRFLLPDGLCDAWVAADVLACSASILSLAAISLDRFMAVTQPLKYKHSIKGSRMYIVGMIATSWILSVAIALPIAVGANYTEHRRSEACAFFNPLFVIFSSMGSFFIPTFVMIVLYWKIFKVIKERAKLARVKRKEKFKALQNAIDVAACHQICGNGVALSHSSNKSTRLPALDQPPSDCCGGGDEDESTPRCRDVSAPGDRDVTGRPRSGNGTASANGHARGAGEMELCADRGRALIWTRPAEATCDAEKSAFLLKPPDMASLSPRERSPSRERTSDRRSHNDFRKGDHKERKATITLVVVLCVFLVCWIPFFVTNNLNAACLQWNLRADFCIPLPPMLFSSFVWLGYFNSTLNPLIYALLQSEYRRAFGKLLCLTKDGGR